MLGLKCLSSGDLGEPQAHSCLLLFALQKRRPLPPLPGRGWAGGSSHPAEGQGGKGA